jgi:hypothetical protein
VPVVDPDQIAMCELKMLRDLIGSVREVGVMLGIPAADEGRAARTAEVQMVAS